MRRTCRPRPHMADVGINSQALNMQDKRANRYTNKMRLGLKNIHYTHFDHKGSASFYRTSSHKFTELPHDFSFSSFYNLALSLSPQKMNWEQIGNNFTPHHLATMICPSKFARGRAEVQTETRERNEVKKHSVLFRDMVDLEQIPEAIGVG